MEEEIAKKKFLMKVGIASFMVLLLVFWILNFKNVFQGSTASDQNNQSWQDIRKDFNDSVDKMSQGLTAIETSNEKLKTASSSLINELIIEANKKASSTAALRANTESLATSSSPSLNATSSFPATERPDTKNNLKNNCPPYINCMPSIGKDKPCQIPHGCEGITQIVY